MTYHRIFDKCNTTGATNEAGHSNSPPFLWGSHCSMFNFLCNALHCLSFYLFHLAIHCMFFFIRLLITFLVSSNFSRLLLEYKILYCKTYYLKNTCTLDIYRFLIPTSLVQIYIQASYWDINSYFVILIFFNYPDDCHVLIYNQPRDSDMKCCTVGFVIPVLKTCTKYNPRGVQVNNYLTPYYGISC